MSRLVCLLYRYFALNVLTNRHINSRFFCFVHFDQRAPQMRVKLIPEITQPGVEADTLIYDSLPESERKKRKKAFLLAGARQTSGCGKSERAT